MKLTFIKYLTVGVAALAISTTHSEAGETYLPSAPPSHDTGFYFDGFGGILFLEDLAGYGSATVDAEFDTGYLAGGTIGYELTHALSIELEGATGAADLESLAINGRKLSSFDGDLQLTQAAVNLILELENNSGITPYVGFGIGGGFADVDFRYPGNSISDDDASLFYQFIGGVNLELNSTMSLYAEYRYGTLDELELQRGGGSVTFEELTSHQAKVGLQVKF